MLLTYLPLTMTIIVMVAGWVNDDQPNFRFSCHKGQILTSIQSIYSKEKKYRLWDFECSDIPTNHSPTTCFHSGYIHRTFARSTVGCLRQESITGIYSLNSSSEEHGGDIGIACCRIEDKFNHFCTNSPFENKLYGPLSFFVPSGKVLTRIISVYDGNTRDREFQFITCTLLNRQTVK